MSDTQATVAGAVAGSLAPLATSGLNAFNGQTALSLASIPWVLMLVFAAIGGTVVFFLAERVRRHVFTYGIAAPFLVLGVVNSHKASLTNEATAAAENAREVAEKAVANQQTATQAAMAATLNQTKAAEASSSRAPELGSEAVEAIVESETPAL